MIPVAYDWHHRRNIHSGQLTMRVGSQLEAVNKPERSVVEDGRRGRDEGVQRRGDTPLGSGQRKAQYTRWGRAARQQRGGTLSNFTLG